MGKNLLKIMLIEKTEFKYQYLELVHDFFYGWRSEVKDSPTLLMDSPVYALYLCEKPLLEGCLMLFYAPS
jgi:hypothetical protein